MLLRKYDESKDFEYDHDDKGEALNDVAHMETLGKVKYIFIIKTGFILFFCNGILKFKEKTYHHKREFVCARSEREESERGSFERDQNHESAQRNWMLHDLFVYTLCRGHFEPTAVFIQIF